MLELRRLGRVVARSSLYRSKAWGVTEQPDFINAAALLETTLAPRELLRALKTIEAQLGRIASYRWGPRAIDLDILAYGDARIDEPDLTIPHARLFERAFALAPLAEIDPSYRAAYEALAPSSRADVERLEPRSRRLLAKADRPAGSTNFARVKWDEALERVRETAEFCAGAGLVRVRVDEDDLEIEVCRSARPQRTAPRPVEAAAVAPVENGRSVPSNGSSHAPAVPGTVLKAEFVGIVRLARPTVVEGTVLGDDRELAYVESLGIRNPVRASGPGRVAAVYVTDGQVVDFGAPLFAIEPLPVR